MKVEITEKGVRRAGKIVAVGEVVTVDGNTMPAGMVNKARVVSGGKVAVTNPAKGALPGSEAKTATEVLAMADGNFMAFKSAASKLLGDQTPSKKDEIVAALEELATKPE